MQVTVASYRGFNPFKVFFAKPSVLKYPVSAQFNKIIEYKPG